MCPFRTIQESYLQLYLSSLYPQSWNSQFNTLEAVREKGVSLVVYHILGKLCLHLLAIFLHRQIHGMACLTLGCVILGVMLACCSPYPFHESKFVFCVSVPRSPGNSLETYISTQVLSYRVTCPVSVLQVSLHHGLEELELIHSLL